MTKESGERALADQNEHNLKSPEEKADFRKSASHAATGDTARLERAFARPQKPLRMKAKKEDTAAQETVRLAALKQQAVSEASAESEEDAAGDTHPVRKVKPLSATRRMPPAYSGPAAGEDNPAGETKRQQALKPPQKVQTVKVSSDAEVPHRGTPQAKQGVKVAARNRRAAEMESIFRHEARMTELPRSRYYISPFYRLKRHGPSKVYRLKGYANREYVKQKRKQDRKRMKRANLIFWIIIIVLLLILFYWLNPIDKIQELMHLFGMS